VQLQKLRKPKPTKGCSADNDDDDDEKEEEEQKLQNLPNPTLPINIGYPIRSCSPSLKPYFGTKHNASSTVVKCVTADWTTAI
jgi:hypothetical protein